jgi:hypothetical protein
VHGRHRQVTWTLLALAAVTWLVTAYLVVDHRTALNFLHFVPAVGMLVIVAAWLHVARRDAALPALRHCAECGTMWQPSEGRACPACAESA